ncbi:polyprenyl synthetase family protein [Nocardia sp. NBC_00565]|uniref:polyprenyl synthetase family protein n=1 Tax=Nocardia sp. NBC_00565 TaxID=2975993 RepID=UPI002E81546D|nr:polyprenyl synthetase family protein [Nocardia sp. NBC_00565]WUC06526.1 polyprenyl synthetase family protein [Nocardia sp. NBC_00565]
MSDRYDPGAFKARVDAALEQFVGQESDQFLAIDPQLRPVADQIVVATTHGKRMRAAFCYWGWRAAGQPDSDALVRAAAAMELVHAAASVHDDIIDDSPLRHGLPTAHVTLREALRDRPSSKSSARALAMLVGDMLMALGGQLFVASGLPSAYLSRARPLWASLARELIAGECLEILCTGAAPDIAESLKVVRYKTAKYTVEQPLLIGGALAGAHPRLLKAFSAYGLPLGEAFQLRDDLLGLFGDPARTGKANLDDLRTRRPTALLAETWQAADHSQRKQLRRLLNRRDASDDDLHEIRDLMTRVRAPARIEAMITARVEEATSALGGVDVAAHAARALTELAHAATARRH